MEAETVKIKFKKDKKIEEINSHGDKLTEIMDSDRLKHWNRNKELKWLKEESKNLTEEIVGLDSKIVPVERRYQWEKEEWEFRIEIL